MSKLTKLPQSFIGAGLVAAATLIALPSTVAAADTECEGTLTGANVDSVDVPDGATCILIDSTVGGNIDVGANAYLQTINTRVRGSVDADGSQTVFLDLGTEVNGNLRTDSTVQVFVFGARVSGNIDVRRSTEVVQVCSSQVNGNLRVRDSGRDILVGDPLAVDCAGNTVGGNAEVQRNVTDVELIVRGNTVRGNLQVSRNTGPSDKAVQSNTGRGRLECSNNAAPFVGAPNQFSIEQGQCN